MSEWKKIDSAPKDGTTIIAVIPGFVPSMVQWMEFDGKGMWSIDPEHFREEDHFSEYFHTSEYTPAYWLPIDFLPKAPGCA